MKGNSTYTNMMHAYNYRSQKCDVKCDVFSLFLNFLTIDWF